MLSAYPLFFDGKIKTRYALGKDFFESGSSILHEMRITLEIRNDIVLSSALDFETALIYEGVINKIGSSDWSDFSHRFIPYIGLRYNFGRRIKNLSNKHRERGAPNQESFVSTAQPSPPETASTPTIRTPSPKPATTPPIPGRKTIQISIPSLELPKIHNVSLGITGGYKRGPQTGFSGLNLTYRGRNPDETYYFFPAVTLATMSKEIEFISSYGSLYGSPYKIGRRILSLSGGVGLNCCHIKALSSILPPNLNPYFESGLGYAFTSYWTDQNSETYSDRDWFSLMWNAGLGVEYWLTEQNAIDLYFNRQHIIDFGSEDFHYWKVNVALTFR